METILSGSFSTVFKKCQAVLRKLDMNVEKVSSKEKIIHATTRGSLLSWGEDIEIRFKEVSANKTKVIVESSANAQIFSWGKDSINENKIINALKEK